MRYTHVKILQRDFTLDGADPVRVLEADYFEPSNAMPKLFTWPSSTAICCEYSG